MVGSTRRVLVLGPFFGPDRGEEGDHKPWVSGYTLVTSPLDSALTLREPLGRRREEEGEGNGRTEEEGGGEGRERTVEDVRTRGSSI